MSLALYVSAIAGYVGIVFLLWIFVLGAKSVMGVLFKDLAPVLEIHKSLGKWGSIAFLLHPLLVAYGYFNTSITVLTYIVLPDIGTDMERHVTLGRVAFYIIIAVWLTSKVLRNQIGYRAWKYIHYLAYIALPFALLHVPDLGTQYANSALVRAYFTACVAVFGLFLVFRLIGWLNLDRKRFTIISHTQITDQDYMFVLRPTGQRRITPKLGQYVYIKKGIISEDHPFSSTYFDTETGELTVTYRVFGSYTRFLTKLQPGQTVSLMGPFGTFTSQLPSSSPQPVVYIAGGIGIAPFAQRIIDESAIRPQLLFAANRTHASAILVPTLREMIGARLVAIYSREAPYDASEEYGHISEEIFKKHIASPNDYHYYICGPQAFVKECRRILESMSIPKDQVFEENFSW